MSKVRKDVVNRRRKIIKPTFYLMPVEWIVALYFKIIGKMKLKKTNFKSYKEPALILCNHASMIDFPAVVLSMFPHRVCWVASIEEFNGREWLFNHLGVVPKRKFTTDLVLIKNIANLISKRKISVCIYPEARFSIAGVNEKIGDGLGKLAKLCKCRIIMIKSFGNYLLSPQWNKHPYRKNKVVVEATQLLSKDEVLNNTSDFIDQKIQDAFVYDEYRYADENKIRIKSLKRAEKIHRILYKCPICKTEGKMDSKGIHLWCNACNNKWEMDEYSKLHCLTNKTTFEYVSDWYKYEREEAYKEVYEGKYHFEDDIRLERLINAKVKFKSVGTIHMVHDINGYTLFGTLDDGTQFNLHKPPLSTKSVHIEYNYKGRGDAIDLATIDATWWVYPLHPVCLTKFNFTTEAIYEYNLTKNHDE